MDGLHSLKGINCPWNPPLPMGSPGNSHTGRLYEMPGSGPMGWNMDGLETIAGSGAKETIHAGGADSLGCAKGLADRSFGADPESRPAHGSGDHKLRRGIYGGHQDLTPTLQRGLAPLVGVASVTACNAGDGQRKGEGQMRWIAVCAETDFPAREAIHELEGRVSARLPRSPDTQWSLASVDVA